MGPACSQLQSPSGFVGFQGGSRGDLGCGERGRGVRGGPARSPRPWAGVPCDEAAPGRLVDSAPRLAGQDAVRRPQLRAHAAAGPPGRLGHGHGRRPPGLACLRAARAGPRPGAPTLLRQGGRPTPEPGGLPALGTPHHGGPGPEWGAAGPRAICLGAGRGVISSPAGLLGPVAETAELCGRCGLRSLQPSSTGCDMPHAQLTEPGCARQGPGPPRGVTVWGRGVSPWEPMASACSWCGAVGWVWGPWPWNDQVTAGFTKGRSAGWDLGRGAAASA